MQTGGSFPGVQSAFEPAGPGAEQINSLTLVLTAVGTAVFIIFALALAWALVHRQRREGKRPLEADRRSARWIVLTGAVVPLLVLVPILFYTFHSLAALDPAGHEADLEIEIRGRQWWWEVRYLDREPARHFVTANELRIPVGRRVKLLFESEDVIHSFWVPSLQGKMDLIPGRRTVLWIEATEPGIYRGQCAEYCGLQHARMALLVRAEPPPDYEAWAERQRLPAPAPVEGVPDPGREAFVASGCVLCHTVRGTPAGGRLGPDLTHVASRATLAAGMLPMNRGNLTGWIANPQAIKPGSRMPHVPLEPATLHAIVNYLMGLE